MKQENVGIIIVDHGSRRKESNELLLQFVELFRNASPFNIIEPAHMEIATPTIANALAACVSQGAERIIVHPYFLLPGNHWKHDIPALVAEAVADFSNVRYAITEPLGLHPLLAEIVRQRIDDCLGKAF